MQSEIHITKSTKRFRLLAMFIIVIFILSIVFPKQVAFANENNWQLEMMNADNAHIEGHKGQGIKIGVVDDIFETGTHGSVIKRVVKHIAPDATVSEHAAYRYQTSQPVNANSDDETFNVDLPYPLDGAATLEMTFNDGSNQQTTTTLTVDEQLNITSSSDEFTELEVVNGTNLKGKYKQGFYQVSFSFTAITSDSLIEAIQEAMDADAHIINISLGTVNKDDKVEEQIKAAVDKGIIIVASSGNDGQYADETYIYYPAADDNVIAVGAVDEDGRYLEMSNYGQVKAPGKFIYDGYIFYGTSIAAPYVTGLTAIYMNQQNSKDVKSLILNNKNEKNIVQYESQEKIEADKSALRTLIDRAETYVAENFTTDSYTELTTALIDAKTVNQSEAATQAEVDKTKGILQTSIDSLVEIEEVPSENDELNEDETPGKEEDLDESEEVDEDNKSEEDEALGKEVDSDEGEELSNDEKSDENEALGKDEALDKGDETSKDENVGKEENSAKDEEPTPIIPPIIQIEVGKATPTLVQPNQTIQIGDTKSTIVTPTDLPEGGALIVKKIDEDDHLIKNLAKLEVAGDVYTVELVDIHPEDFAGTFTLTLSYDKDVEGVPAIYSYHEVTKEWEKRGGTIDEATSTISLDVAHFFTYGVFAPTLDEEERLPQPESESLKDELEEERTENTEDDPKRESEVEPTELRPIIPDLDYQRENGIKIIPTEEEIDTKDKNVKDNEDKDKEEVVQDVEEELPHTATSNYNFIIVGLLLIFSGVLFAVRLRRKRV